MTNLFKSILKSASKSGDLKHLACLGIRRKKIEVFLWKDLKGTIGFKSIKRKKSKYDGPLPKYMFCQHQLGMSERGRWLPCYDKKRVLAPAVCSHVANTTLPPLGKYLLQFGKIHMRILTNILLDIDKYILVALLR